MRCQYRQSKAYSSWCSHSTPLSFLHPSTFSMSLFQEHQLQGSLRTSYQLYAWPQHSETLFMRMRVILYSGISQKEMAKHSYSRTLILMTKHDLYSCQDCPVELSLGHLLGAGIVYWFNSLPWPPSMAYHTSCYSVSWIHHHRIRVCSSTNKVQKFNFPSIHLSLKSFS